MGKKVLFIVVDNNGGKIDKDTKASVIANIKKEDNYVFVNVDNDNQELYYKLKSELNKAINDVNNFDYMCVIPNKSKLGNNAKTIFEEYQTDRDDNVIETYLPLVLYNKDDIKLVLNKHIWNSQIAYSAGVLDITLALKQIDSTLFGAFIPVNLFFNESYYHDTVKYYQQYHLLSNLTDEDNIVLGIPKILLTITSWDFKYEGVSNEDKIVNFELAKEKWVKQNNDNNAKK